MLLLTRTGSQPKLHDVSKAFSRSREPPVSEDEDHERDGSKVSETTPIGRAAVEKNAAVAADQRSEWIEIDERAKTFGHNRLWINYRCQVHPRHQQQHDALRDVAEKNSE